MQSWQQSEDKGEDESLAALLELEGLCVGERSRHKDAMRLGTLAKLE